MKNNKILHILLTIALVFTMVTPVAVKADSIFQVYSPADTSATKEARFSGDGGSHYLVVVPMNGSTWTAKPSASWITTSKQTGNANNPTVDIIVSANSTVSSRTGYVDFVTPSETYRFNVIQDGKTSGTSSPSEPLNIYIEKPSVQVSYYGENIFITVASNYAWTATSENSWIYFIDQKQSSGKAGQCNAMYIGVKPNTSSNPRQGRIIVSSGGQTRTINIYQGSK